MSPCCTLHGVQDPTHVLSMHPLCLSHAPCLMSNEGLVGIPLRPSWHPGILVCATCTFRITSPPTPPPYLHKTLSHTPHTPQTHHTPSPPPQLFHVYGQDSGELDAAIKAKVEAQQRAQIKAAKGGKRGKYVSASSSPPKGQVQRTGRLAMTFVQFLQVCQDRGLVGGGSGLAPRDLENVFR